MSAGPAQPGASDRSMRRTGGHDIPASRTAALWRRLLVPALAGGVLTALCWLPLGLAPLMPLAIVPALRGLRRVRTYGDALLFGAVLEAALVAVGAHYILALLAFSWLAVFLLALDILYHIPFALVEACGSLWLERRSGLPRTIGFGVLYSLMEWLRSKSDLSNCADLLAHGFGSAPQWLAWEPWTGPFALSLLAFGVAAALDAAIERRRLDPRRALALAVGGMMLWLAPPATDWLTRGAAAGHGESLRIGIVQPSFTPKEKLEKQYWPESWERLARLTREAARNSDLVVWPESTRPGYLFWKETEPFGDPQVEALARQAGVPILYGCVVARVAGDRVVALYNAAALVRADGEPADWYAKQKLLPFVEGVPFAGFLGWDPAEARRSKPERTSYLTLAGNLSPGSRPTVFSVGPARIGVLICFEGLYPQLVRRYRLAGANALCVMTNDAWFARSVFALWHARMVSARAREADVPVVRAANSGVSSVTDRTGRMGDSSGLFEVTTLNVPLEPSPSGPTFYSRSGDLIVWGEFAILAALIAFGLLRRRGA